jgi:hypothetical protein
MPTVPFSVEWTRVRTFRIILDKGNGVKGDLGLERTYFGGCGGTDWRGLRTSEAGFDGSVVA